MDPEVNERFERIERNIATLTDIVLSLGRSASEHDESLAKHHEMLAKHDEAIAKLEEAASAHDHRLDEVTEVVGQLAKLVSGFASEHERDRLAMKEDTKELREAQRKTDEELGILIRMFEEWIRNKPRDGQG